eukprot:TRINITY_DN21601_c0_g1_i11.p1 TRINITY_DN21601_c0_g1~~TRINITY_DN21601_c0_g1_i11.p1  ORF type:complete len:487 (+),score=122.92 TRINITY_DN21601_c0_g1_i11:81-1541(+)
MPSMARATGDYEVAAPILHHAALCAGPPPSAVKEAAADSNVGECTAGYPVPTPAAPSPAPARAKVDAGAAVPAAPETSKVDKYDVMLERLLKRWQAQDARALSHAIMAAWRDVSGRRRKSEEDGLKARLMRIWLERASQHLLKDYCLHWWAYVKRKQLDDCRSQSQKLADALAVPKEEPDSSPRHLVRLSLSGASFFDSEGLATGTSASSKPASEAQQLYCLCEVPGRRRSRVATEALSRAKFVPWKKEFPIFLGDDECLHFTVLEGNGALEAGDDSEAYPATDRVVGKAILNAGFCFGGFDGELPIEDASGPRGHGVMGTLRVKVAVGVFKFRSPAAAMAPGEEEALKAASHAEQSETSRRQQQLGAQSKRGGALQTQLDVLSCRPHAKLCFGQFARREEELSSDWAVFYHSYSYSALLYELNAAIAAALFKFPSDQATLPRLLVHDFAALPDADTLMRRLPSYSIYQACFLYVYACACLSLCLA